MRIDKTVGGQIRTLGTATPPTDPIVFGDLMAFDAGTETGSEMSGQGGLRPLHTVVPTEDRLTGVNVTRKGHDHGFVFLSSFWVSYKFPEISKLAKKPPRYVVVEANASKCCSMATRPHSIQEYYGHIGRLPGKRPHKHQRDPDSMPTPSGSK
jgi:hypothetical protein